MITSSSSYYLSTACTWSTVAILAFILLIISYYSEIFLLTNDSKWAWVDRLESIYCWVIKPTFSSKLANCTLCRSVTDTQSLSFKVIFATWSMCCCWLFTHSLNFRILLMHIDNYSWKVAMAVLDLVQRIRKLSIPIKLPILPNVAKHLSHFVLQGVVAFQPGLVAWGSFFALLAF